MQVPKKLTLPPPVSIRFVSFLFFTVELRKVARNEWGPWNWSSDVKYFIEIIGIDKYINTASGTEPSYLQSVEYYRATTPQRNQHRWFNEKMGEIVSESSVVESKMEGSTMNADELRLAQMGMSLHFQIDNVVC